MINQQQKSDQESPITTVTAYQQNSITGTLGKQKEVQIRTCKYG